MQFELICCTYFESEHFLFNKVLFLMYIVSKCACIWRFTLLSSKSEFICFMCKVVSDKNRSSEQQSCQSDSRIFWSMRLNLLDFIFDLASLIAISVSFAVKDEFCLREHFIWWKLDSLGLQNFSDSTYSTTSVDILFRTGVFRGPARDEFLSS